MDLQTSRSEVATPSLKSNVFGLLHEKLQKVLWSMQWDSLRDIQEASVEPILSKQTDIIISAPTASGKTEAAFLPIISDLIANPQFGLGALYVSPLKALINDQFDRLGLICEKVELPIHQWHGDVSQSHKKEVLKNASGLLLITPESLEAIFVNRGTQVFSLFGNLQYIVIDELHSFIGTERGKQLQSLLHRIEVVVKRTVPRIALSATIGDLDFAARYLRPENSLQSSVITSDSDAQEVQLLLKGYRIKEVDIKQVQEDEDDELALGDKHEIAQEVYRRLRGTNNLVFANSRRNVEDYSYLLTRESELSGIPNEFFPHHGSLSKELRQSLEQRLKSKTLPTTAVCTSTLELGIDIGTVKSIAQIGCPPSVASMRQRLGRSGRRGDPSIMRMYVQEKEITARSPLNDRIRSELVQTIAMVNLLIRKWYEKPQVGRLHYSTLIQQLLSVIVQYGSISAKNAYQLLVKSAPFDTITQNQFVLLLRSLAEKDFISQMENGELLLGVKGEKVVNHYSFYTAFQTDQDFQIVSHAKVLGTLPINYPIEVNQCMIFAGRRWRMVDIDYNKKVIAVEKAPGGKAPNFSGNGGTTDDAVRQEMKKVYLSSDVPAYLDKTAIDLLAEGRECFYALELDKKSVVSYDNLIHIFPWSGDIVMNTFMLQLKADGFEVLNENIALTILRTSEEKVIDHLKKLIQNGFANLSDLARTVTNKMVEKYDGLLPEELQTEEYIYRNMSTAAFDLLSERIIF